jgi:hypothetical protein
MGREDVAQYLRERPFRPFRLLLSNGTTYEIRHPEMAIPTPWSVYVGVPAPQAPPPSAEGIVVVSLMHVVQIEHISPSPTASAG